MKFGKYLDDKARSEWADEYVDYKKLKDLIKEAVDEVSTGGAGGISYSPRTTSLSVMRAHSQRDAAEERFFRALDDEVKKVSNFTESHVRSLETDLDRLNDQVRKSETRDADRERLEEEAQRLGDKYLALEKYVNLNYMGFHKILKKHDKMLPHAPCQQFYISHLHQQKWVQGTSSNILVRLSTVYSQLRGDTSGVKNEDSAQGFVRSTTKYWVRTADVSPVKHHILQHLPVFTFDNSDARSVEDWQLINSVYLDNDSVELYHGRLDKTPEAIALRMRWYGPVPKTVFVERKTHREGWKGEESVKERIVLDESLIVPFLEGTYTLDAALADLDKKKRSEQEKKTFAKFFSECQKVVDSKQLRPMMRTQYQRTAFQIPFDSSVRVSLDTNLTMFKENPDDGPSCHDTKRWRRDPALPLSRTEVTRFPHAVLEVKLSLPAGEAAPDWIKELLSSGYLTEVHKFSKFIHGGATLLPHLVRAVPYWVDDESVRPSMLMSAPATTGSMTAGPPGRVAAGSSDAIAARHRLAARGGYQELSHPLLGSESTLQLLPDRSAITGLGNSSKKHGKGFFSWLFNRAKPRKDGLNKCIPQRIEPKTFFANERTFLSWLHMAVTIGSIGAALLGFSGVAARTARISHHRHGVADVTDLIAMILLPLAILMCGYALMVFLWRGSRIAQKQVGYIDDWRGPLLLAVVVATALSGIFIVSTVDLALQLKLDLAA